MGVRDAFDEAVGAESSQVVGDLAGGDGVGSRPAELGGERAEVAVGEAVELGRKVSSADSRAWLRCWPSRSPGMRVPVAVMTGSVMVCRASVPVIGSWLSRWTRSRRRLAEKPISRSAGRLVSRFPISKSRVSLMVVSVRRARPSLWYCLIRVCL